MWLFTTVGFFSVTQTQLKLNSPIPAGHLQIRSRVFKDLEVLREKYLPELTETIHIPGRDYPYRGFVDKASFSAALVQIVSDLTYNNFKDEVTVTQGKDRHDLYSRVWGVMYQAEETLEKMREKREADAERYKAAPMLPFERKGEKEYQDEKFNRDLVRELEARERETERRIEDIKYANTWGRSSQFEDDQWDRFGGRGPYGDTPDLATEIMGLDHMSVVDEAELFTYGSNDEPPIDFGDDSPPARYVYRKPDDSKSGKRRKKNRRRNRH